jgi:hypothetical protein
VEIQGLGGASFERAVERFRAGEPVRYRGMDLVLRQTAFECRVPWNDPPEAVTDRRALEALTRARFRLGALLASAPPLDAVIGNRERRLVLVHGGGAEPGTLGTPLYDLRGDRLRRLAGGGGAGPTAPPPGG